MDENVMKVVFVGMIAVGLIVCFGGIYLKKACAAMAGFLNGALLTMIVIMMTGGAVQLVKEESVAYVLIFAIIGAIVSAVHEKVCAFANGFIAAFVATMALILMTQAPLSYEDEKVTTILMLAGIVAAIVGGIAVYVADYAFMLETAFTGAFIASLGAAGLYDKAYDLSDVARLFLREDYMSSILVGTIVLGIVGFVVQLNRWKKGKGIIHESAISPQKESMPEKESIPERVIIFEEENMPEKENLPERVVISEEENMPEKENLSKRVIISEEESMQEKEGTNEKELSKLIGPPWKCACGKYNFAEDRICGRCGKKRDE